MVQLRRNLTGKTNVNGYRMGTEGISNGHSTDTEW